MKKKIIIAITCIVVLTIAATVITNTFFSYRCYDCDKKVFFQNYTREETPGDDSARVYICSDCYTAYSYGENPVPNEPDYNDTDIKDKNTNKNIKETENNKHSGEGEPGFDALYYEVILASAELLYPSSNDEWEYIVYQDNLGHYDRFVELNDCLIDSEKGTIEIPSEIEGYPVIALNGWGMGYYKNIKELIIPDTVIHIGSEFCRNCESLETLKLSNSLVTIGEDAFVGHNLTELTIPASVRRIEETAFFSIDSSDNYTLDSVVLPETLEYLGCIGVNAREITVLNPDLQYGERTLANSPADVIYGYVGSTTADLCAKHGYSFKPIE